MWKRTAVQFCSLQIINSVNPCNTYRLFFTQQAGRIFRGFLSFVVPLFSGWKVKVRADGVWASHLLTKFVGSFREHPAGNLFVHYREPFGGRGRIATWDLYNRHVTRLYYSKPALCKLQLQLQLLTEPSFVLYVGIEYIFYIKRVRR
jgi:hypothetical protein